mgnify:CR=1 FL=1
MGSSLLSILKRIRIVAIAGLVALFWGGAGTVARSQTEEEFWARSQQLTANHLYLLYEIERAFALYDRDRLSDLRTRLAIQRNRLENFLEVYDPAPEVICDRDAPFLNAPEEDPFAELAFAGAPLEFSQLRVYCALASSYADLEAVSSEFTRRVNQLARIPVLPETAPLDAPSLTLSPLRLEIGLPETYLLSPWQIEALGVPVKPAIEGARPVIPPAILPVGEVAVELQEIRQDLQLAVDLFPPEWQFRTPEQIAETFDRRDYGLFPHEPSLYAEFLNLPNTGIARILTDRVYGDVPDNRLLPTVLDRFPFPALLPPAPETGFVPRLEMQVSDDRFQLLFPIIDYGYIVDIGDIPIEEISLDLEGVNLSPKLREFFLGYHPPTELDNIQEDRQRILLGKLSDFGLEDKVLTVADAEVGRTYLVRSIQYELPDFIVTNRQITHRERRMLAYLLDTPSRDVLVAFRPVDRRDDGSYVLLWRTIAQFNDPEITDLYRYVNYPD